MNELKTIRQPEVICATEKKWAVKEQMHVPSRPVFYAAAYAGPASGLRICSTMQSFNFQICL